LVSGGESDDDKFVRLSGLIASLENQQAALKIAVEEVTRRHASSIAKRDAIIDEREREALAARHDQYVIDIEAAVRSYFVFSRPVRSLVGFHSLAVPSPSSVIDFTSAK